MARIAWWGLLLLGLAPGCIARHRAPDDPVPVTTPYAALALYRQILPLSGPGDLLPRAALRLAVHPDGSVFADTALVEAATTAGIVGGEATAGIAESWPAAMALLGARTEPIVLLLSEMPDGDLCARLAPLRDRVLRATRPTEAPLHPLQARDPAPEDFSADPLVGRPLRAACPDPALSP